MRSVYKYTLEEADRMELDLPVGAEILSIQYQHGQPRLWALVDTAETRTETRFLRMAGTGHAIMEGGLKFISTVVTEGGMLVFHFFELVGKVGKLK